MLSERYTISRDIYKVSKGQTIGKHLNFAWDLMRRLLTRKEF